MKTWNDWSDFEINKVVAILAGHKCYYDNGTYTNDNVSVVVKGNGVLGWFDPCNNPADMWPIIVENRIAVIEPDGMEETKWSAGQVYDMAEWYSDDNPLRAAAIVFLIMNGVNPE